MSPTPTTGPPTRASTRMSEHTLEDFSHSYDRLTKREREVLDQLSTGRTLDEIALELCLSIHTIRQYTQNVLTTLHARSQREAVCMLLNFRLNMQRDDMLVSAREKVRELTTLLDRGAA